MLGAGMLVFLIWELLKPVLVVLLVKGPPASERAAVIPESVSKAVLVMSVAALMLLVLLNVVLRVWVGVSARAEAAGRRRGRAYVVFAFVLFALQIAELVQGLLQLFRPGLPGGDAS